MKFILLFLHQKHHPGWNQEKQSEVDYTSGFAVILYHFCSLLITSISLAQLFMMSKWCLQMTLITATESEALYQ